MSNVSQWSVTAGSNNSASPDGAPEGMAPSGVNDSAREVMAALAKWFQDQDGTLVTTGSANTYALTTKSVNAALGDQSMLAFRVNVANTAASTLNVDSLGAKAIKISGAALTTGAIATDQNIVVSYNATNDEYDIIGGHNAGAGVGTSILISASSASSDATKAFTGIDNTYDEYELHLLNVIPATDARDLYILTSANGGSSYDVAASDYLTGNSYQEGTTNVTSGGSTPTTEITITNSVGSAANELGVSCVIRIVRPSESTYTNIWGDGMRVSSTGGQTGRMDFAGTRRSAAAVDAVQIKFNTGDIESGLFALYGIKRS